MHITFVCTGNICRSPMAEMIARRHHGDTHSFDSSGLWAMTGWGMTDPAVVALAELGIDDDGHVARPFSDAVDSREPDVVWVMTNEHLDQVIRARPDLAGRTELLDPEGRDIGDPYGGSLHDYRRARDRIQAAIEARLGGVA